MNYVGLFAAVSLLNVLCVSALYVLLPQFRGQFTGEDQLVENLSAGLFLATFVVAVISLRGRRGRSGFRTLILVAALGALCFLEEQSYGERIFGWSMPEVRGVKIDALHDLFVLGCKTLGNLLGIARRQGGYVVAGVGVVAVGLALVYRRTVQRIYPWLKNHPAYLLLSLFVALGILGQIIDLRMVDFAFLYMFEELFEMNAALALLFAALYVVRVQGAQEPAQGGPAAES